MLEKANRCQLCGTAPWEWDPAQGGHRFAYEAAEEICQGCLRKQAAQETSGSQPGTSVILIPTNTHAYRVRQERVEKRWREQKKRQQELDATAKLKKRPVRDDSTG